MVNGIVPLISLSDFLLFAYRNTRDFCVLNLYFAILLNSLISSSNFLVATLGFSMYRIMSSINGESFTSLPIRIPFISFSSLIAVARPSKTLLNNSVKNGCLCHVPNLRGNVSSFSALSMFAVGLSCSVLCLVTQSRASLYNPRDCSPPGSSVHGDSPGKNSGVGCHAFLQRIFLTQGKKPRSPTLQADNLPLSHQGSPRILEWIAYTFSRESSQLRTRTRIFCIAGRFFTNRAKGKHMGLPYMAFIMLRYVLLMPIFPSLSFLKNWYLFIWLCWV